MARGKKTDTETIYKIMQCYFMYGNFSDVASELNVPESTVRDIVHNNKDNPDFTELRDKTRRKFSKDFERIISKAMNRLDREIDEQERIPVSQLSTVVGTLYDKNRLEHGESTENTNNTIQIGFSEEMQELSK